VLTPLKRLERDGGLEKSGRSGTFFFSESPLFIWQLLLFKIDALQVEGKVYTI
jgi:hypothetical protein